jgi:hypothetical protein
MQGNNGSQQKKGISFRSGKSQSQKVTKETAKTLERAGSFESAKIAREIAKRD